MNNTHNLTPDEIAAITTAIALCPEADSAIAYGDRQVAILGMAMTQDILSQLSAQTGVTLTLFEALSDADAEQIFLNGEVIQ